MDAIELSQRLVQESDRGKEAFPEVEVYHFHTGQQYDIVQIYFEGGTVCIDVREA